MKTKKYTPEIRAAAVRQLVKSPDKRTEIAKQYGVHVATLYRWRKNS